MRISDIKGEDAFKVLGQVVGYLRDLFQDEELSEIATTQRKGWLLEFFSTSLEKKSDTWMNLFLALNPDKKKEDISIATVITFAYDFKNDPELMSLFFSQGGQTVNNSSGSPTVNITEIEKK